MYAMSPLESLPRARESPFALLTMLTRVSVQKSQGASKDAGDEVRA